VNWRTVLGYLLGDEPWEKPEIDLKSPAVRRMVARAIRANRREVRGARIVPKFSRDPVVERRERLVEQRAQAEADSWKPVLAWKAGQR
jgi:hypothetical protein